MQSFLEVLHEHGLAPEEIIADGNLHRCPTLEKPRKRNGAYIAHMDKPVTLWWCNWETGEQETYCAEEKQSFSPSELFAWQERQKAIKRQREAESAKRHAEAAQQAKTEWKAAYPCSPEHPYLRKKALPHWMAYAKTAITRCLSLFWTKAVHCKVCNAFIPMVQSVFLLAEKSRAVILSFVGNRKSQ